MSKNDSVYLSRRAGALLSYLDLEYREKLREAIADKITVDEVPQPFRKWLLDFDTIALEARSKSGDAILRKANPVFSSEDTKALALWRSKHE